MLKSLAPRSWEKVRQIISDFAHSPKLAYENIEGKPIEVWTACEESSTYKISFPVQMPYLISMKLWDFNHKVLFAIKLRNYLSKYRVSKINASQERKGN